MKLACGFLFGLCGVLCASELSFEKASQEIHAAMDADEVTFKFAFENSSKKPVKIDKLDPGCSCMAATLSDGKMVYAPGEKGTLTATFDARTYSGTVDRTIGIWLDGAPADQPSQGLSVKIHIPVPVIVEPKTVKWEVGDPAEPKTIHIQVSDSSKPLHMLGVSSSSEAFTFELKTVKDGEDYQLTVTPAATAKPGLAIFRIKTDSEIERHKIQQAYAVVQKARTKKEP